MKALAIGVGVLGAGFGLISLYAYIGLELIRYYSADPQWFVVWVIMPYLLMICWLVGKAITEKERGL